MQETWITRRLELAIADKSVQLPIPPLAYAITIFGVLQSGLVSARLFAKPDRLDASSSMLRSAIAVNGNKQTQASQVDAVALI